MQLLNALIALGGDRDTTVPKIITAAEVPVLQAIHGADAVFDLEVVGEEVRSNREELERLAMIYGNTRDEHDRPVMPQVYPGAGAQVFQTVDQIELPVDRFKAGVAWKPKTAEAKKGRKRAEAPAEETPAAPAEDEDDGISDVMD